MVKANYSTFPVHSTTTYHVAESCVHSLQNLLPNPVRFAGYQGQRSIWYGVSPEAEAITIVQKAPINAAKSHGQASWCPSPNRKANSRG